MQYECVHSAIYSVYSTVYTLYTYSVYVVYIGGYILCIHKCIHLRKRYLYILSLCSMHMQCECVHSVAYGVYSTENTVYCIQYTNCKLYTKYAYSTRYTKYCIQYTKYSMISNYAYGMISNYAYKIYLRIHQCVHSVICSVYNTVYALHTYSVYSV